MEHFIFFWISNDKFSVHRQLYCIVAGYINTRFTIAVAAVGKDGKHASYSTVGAAVFVTGPGTTGLGLE